MRETNASVLSFMPISTSSVLALACATAQEMGMAMPSIPTVRTEWLRPF
jgi:hypothetical protein